MRAYRPTRCSRTAAISPSSNSTTSTPFGSGRAGGSCSSPPSIRHPPGEGKTTTTIGLGDALNRIGRKAVIALREPSQGPGCSGARAERQAAVARRSRRWTPSTCTSPATSTRSPPPTTCWPPWSTTTSTGATRWTSTLRAITWRRVVDVNDRALRKVVVNLGEGANGPAARDRFRHHRRVRGSWPCSASPATWRTCRPGWPASWWPAAARESRFTAGDLEAPRGHGGAPARRDPAQPRPDPGGQSGARARRAFRQHRPRLQLGDRHPHRAEARRVRRDRGGFRRRPRSGEVLRHQVPQRRPGAQRRRSWSQPCGR